MLSGAFLRRCCMALSKRGVYDSISFSCGAGGHTGDIYEKGAAMRDNE